MESQHFFRLKAGVASCTVLQLLDIDLDGIEKQLAGTVSQAPDFFQGVPVVIDLEKLKADTVPHSSNLKALLLNSGLIPVGIRHANEEQRQAAVEEGLPELTTGKVIQPSEKNEPKNTKYPRARTQMVFTPVRSGAQVYAKEGDLVVIAPVSAGAELLAEGNIHVYGPLRGRALAGVQGDHEARIFCTRLEAELVSIAGYYLTQDDMLQIDFPEQEMIQIFLDGEQVRVEPLSQNH